MWVRTAPHPQGHASKLMPVGPATRCGFGVRGNDTLEGKDRALEEGQKPARRGGEPDGWQLTWRGLFVTIGGGLECAREGGPKGGGPRLGLGHELRGTLRLPNRFASVAAWNVPPPQSTGF